MYIIEDQGSVGLPPLELACLACSNIWCKKNELSGGIKFQIRVVIELSFSCIGLALKPKAVWPHQNLLLDFPAEKLYSFQTPPNRIGGPEYLSSNCR